MAAARKKENKPLPPRPPGPKLSMSKGRQHSTGSIAIRFNAASMEENWDDVSLQDPAEKKAKSQRERDALEFGLDARELLVSQSILQDVDVYSKSAPVSEVTTPEGYLEGELPNTNIDDLSPDTVLSMTNQLRLAQNLAPLPPPPSAHTNLSPTVKIIGTERSFISGIKERIQGMQDPLQAFTGKIEDFIAEKGIIDPRKLRKGETMDNKTLVISASDSEISEMDHNNLAAGMNGANSHTALSQRNSDPSALASEADDTLLTEVPVNLSQTKPEFSDDTSKPEQLLKHRPASFDMGNEYYTVQAEDYNDAPVFENGSQAGPFPKSCSMDTFSRQTGQPLPSRESPKKIKATLQKLIQPIAGRGSSTVAKSTASPNRPVMMSLSGLLNSNANDGDDGSTSAESDQFYDPQDELTLNTVPQSASAEPLSGASPVEQTVLGKPPPRPPSPEHRKKSNFPSRHKLFAVFVVVLAYLLVPLPTYMAGMVFGAFLTTVAIFAYLWWTEPPKTREPFFLPELSDLPPLEVPEMKASRNDEDEFKGWMNELHQYDEDDYHIGQTHSILVHLEGTKLRLQTPKFNIPKRAFWDEPNYYTSTFVKQRHYDLIGAKILLVPEKLVQKRIWSKKYPICLILTQDHRPGSPVSPDSVDDKSATVKIYLFARCARDKEEWFRRFEAASVGKPLPTQLVSMISASERKHRRMSSSSSLDNFMMKHKRQGSTDSNISDTGKESPTRNCDTGHEKRLANYLRYMARVIPSESQQRLRAQADNARRDSTTPLRLPTAVKCEPQVAWVNSLITRAFWDFLREEYWVNKIREKIQKKIGKIHIPWFIDDLTVTGCELGNEMPVIRRASKPYIDDRGLWIDLDIAYTGGFRLQLETKCNLMKLKQKPVMIEKVPKKQQDRSPITHSDEEDSAESSTDEEACEENAEDEKLAQAPTVGTSGKIMRIVDKITQSKYFHKATEYKYIKKAMEGVSNTRLVLIVEVKNIAGQLAINIPPPPTDRLWYGFRNNPRLWLSAKPWVGEREVSLSHVTDWIEKKLAVEFQRVFVMPNMDDIPIPIMCDHLNQEPETDVPS